MFKKATHSSTPGVRPSIQKNVSILRQGEGKQKSKKKGVTWADQIPQAMPSKEDAGTIRTVGLKDYTILEGLSQTVESGCLETPQPASTANGTEEYISAPIVNESASTLARFRWSSISTQASESDAIENMSGIWVETPISQNSSYEVPGWDSDLPELTGSQAEAESQGESSETEVNEVCWKTTCLLSFCFLRLSSETTGPTTLRTNWAEDPHPGSSRWGLFQEMPVPQVPPTHFRWLSLEIMRFMSSKKSRLPAPKA